VVVSLEISSRFYSFAADKAMAPDGTQKLSDRSYSSQTSAPHVHLANRRDKNGDESGRTDRILVNKTTIVAFMPVGK
jgi:hypothetical protein